VTFGAQLRNWTLFPLVLPKEPPCRHVVASLLQRICDYGRHLQWIGGSARCVLSVMYMSSVRLVSKCE
jgi:hypothetical protein